MDQPTTTPVTTETPSHDRKPYVAPALTDFGAFAEITQGASGAGGVDATFYS